LGGPRRSSFCSLGPGERVLVALLALGGRAERERLEAFLVIAKRDLCSR
jgi:hypothetical protein